MKYPIGVQSFEKIRTNGYCYVDKTALIYKLVNEGSVYFLSRPRRFGKSLLVDTLECYFHGRKELFQGLAMEQLEKDWYEYPVFRIDFSGAKYTDEEALEKRINEYLSKWEELYGSKEYEQTIGGRFYGVLERAYEKTGRKAVVLIDEYDKPLLDVFDSGLHHSKHHQLLEEEHRNTLREFYAILKKADKYTKFVLLTGVTKFAQVSVFSGLNNLKDISLYEDYETLCGITLDELRFYFKESITEFAAKLNVSFDEMVAQLKSRYDGYHFGKSLTDVFNPFSLLCAFDAKDMRDYWFSTGSPDYLVRLMAHSKVDITEIINEDYTESGFMDYKATADNPLPILFQSGYLTIKSYDRDWNNYRLDIPNEEVRSGFLPLLTSTYFRVREESAISDAQKMAKALMEGNVEAFKLRINRFLASIPYNSHEPLKYEHNTEKFFHMVFYLIMRLVGSYRLTTRVEETTSSGRLDCVVETPQYIYIFEFKLNASARKAMEQIEESHYADGYLNDGRKVVCIAANFNSETKNIDDWEVKM